MKTALLIITAALVSCADSATMMRAQDNFHRTEAAAAVSPTFGAQFRYEMMCYMMGVRPRVGIGRGPNPYLTRY